MTSCIVIPSRRRGTCTSCIVIPSRRRGTCTSCIVIPSRRRGTCTSCTVIPSLRRGTCFCFFQRAIPFADCHIDRQHVDAVASRIGNQLRRRVKAHRLRIEQCAAKRRGLVVLQP